MKQRLFTAGKTIYWPSDFVDIVNLLKGFDSSGQPSHHTVYRYNSEIVVFAAILGLIHEREKDVGPRRLEIDIDTFESQKFGNSSLASFILLIPLLGTQDLELLRPEREEELIKKFQCYAAGGFEYLRGALSTSTDPTGQSVILAEINRTLEFQNRLNSQDSVKI